MSLPMAWVEKIFQKLTLTFGRDFTSRWEGIPLEEVKADWAHELAWFEAHPQAIAHALQNLTAKPPTVQEFRALCKTWTAPQPLALQQPPRKVPTQFEAKIAALLKPVEVTEPTRVQVARRYCELHGGKKQVNPFVKNNLVKMARVIAGYEAKPDEQERPHDLFPSC